MCLASSAGNPVFECFGFGEPLEGDTDFPLSEPVLSYGYTIQSQDRKVDGRLMRGHIQRRIVKIGETAQHVDYELSFPAFPGHSGSPIMRDENRQEVIAVTTHGYSFSSTLGEAQTTAHWTIAAALHSVADWLREL